MTLVGPSHLPVCPLLLEPSGRTQSKVRCQPDSLRNTSILNLVSAIARQDSTLHFVCSNVALASCAAALGQSQHLPQKTKH